MILIDILTDGMFAAIAAIGFGAISDPPLRAFHCSTCRHWSRPAVLPDDVLGCGHCDRIFIRFFQHRYGKSCFGKTYLLPHDCTLHSGTVAYDSGYVCL